MGMSPPIVKTCAKVAGGSGNEHSCSRGHSMATAADMTVSCFRLSKIRVSVIPQLVSSASAVVTQGVIAPLTFRNARTDTVSDSSCLVSKRLLVLNPPPSAGYG